MLLMLYGMAGLGWAAWRRRGNAQLQVGMPA